MTLKLHGFEEGERHWTTSYKIQPGESQNEWEWYKEVTTNHSDRKNQDFLEAKRVLFERENFLE